MKAVASLILLLPLALFAGEGAAPAEVPADIRDMSRPKYLNELAEVHLKFGALGKAEELLKKAAANAKDDEDKSKALYLLGMVLLKKDDLKGAQTSLEDALSKVTNGADRQHFASALIDVYNCLGLKDRAAKLQSELSAIPVAGPERNDNTARGQWTGRC